MQILYSYVQPNTVLAKALVADDVRGIVFAGTGAGSLSKAEMAALKPLIELPAQLRPVLVRSSRTGNGRVISRDDYDVLGMIPADTLNPQKGSGPADAGADPDERPERDPTNVRRVLRFHPDGFGSSSLTTVHPTSSSTQIVVGNLASHPGDVEPGNLVMSLGDRRHAERRVTGRGLLAPVFDSKPGYTRHVLDVRGHERGAECDGMRSDRSVEILDARPTSFERGIDEPIRMTHGVGPLDALHF